MVELVRQSQPKRAALKDAPFISADVGGTYARIGLVQRERGSTVKILAYRKYLCADFPQLSDILHDFIAKEAKGAVASCALAVAGYVIDGRVINYNLPWQVSEQALRQSLGIEALAIINDFEAVAHAASRVDPAKTVLLAGPEIGTGPLIVVGPGTGLGSALCIPGPKRSLVLATEAGQTSLAPGDSREREVLAALARGGDYVSHERILCGPGMVTLYGVLSQLHGRAAQANTSEAITLAALDGTDAVARETLDTFCALLGGFVGNLALLYGARGGVYLTGGILPGMREFLVNSRFVERFLDKGRMRAFLERIPVRLMEHGQLGVIGAAGWYLERLEDEE